MAKSVTVIPQTINRYNAQSIALPLKRRVAGYARVSTDSEEQSTSYEAQINYYTQYIQSNPDWLFVKVYADEGITGTNTRHRDGFNEMVADAIDGKIDLIVTKSVSRFARNTVDSLVTIRKLKEYGCECYFEKENIYTFDGKGELLLTIMSSLAQEESRSISENVTWGARKRFADGKVSMAYKHFLGYEKGEDGTPAINDEQAEVIRFIYRLFLDGKTPCAIAHELTEKGVPTPGGKKKWLTTTVLSILSNEKYKGDALLQKCFTVDFLTKKQKKNEGEVPQYYVTGSHPAIIPPEEFDMVQAELDRRKNAGRSYSGINTLASKLICGDCGAYYGQKVWHSTDAYRTLIYRCNRKYAQQSKCSTPTLREETVQRAFLRAYNLLMADRKELLADCRIMLTALQDETEIQNQLNQCQEEMTLTAELNRRLIHERATSSMNAQEFNDKVLAYDKRYQKAMEKYNELQDSLDQQRRRGRELNAFLQNLANQPLVLEKWDSQLWSLLVRDVTVYAGGMMRFCFKNGKTIEVNSL